MLLGDGSPTRHLRLLTGHSVQVRLVAMDADDSSDDAIGGPRPTEVQELDPPLLRRQVWLDCGGTTPSGTCGDTNTTCIPISTGYYAGSPTS